METDVDSTTDGDNESLHSDDDGEDPCRIQIELDELNNASDSINKLETELEKARDKFVKTKALAEIQLKELLKKIGARSVRAARSYYNQLKELKRVQLEAQRATAKYQDAFSAYTLAKDAVHEAELQLALEGQATTPLVDSTCQEILNKATIALFNAEKEKITCEQEHHVRTSQCSEYQKQTAQLLQDNPKAVQRAKRFYDLKDVLESKIKASTSQKCFHHQLLTPAIQQRWIEKQNAEDLQLALACNKQKYKLALNNLEHISEEVHARRKSKLALPPRTPGVGAEAESEFSDLPSSTLDFLSETTSQCSLEFCDNMTRKDVDSHSASTHELHSDVLEEEEEESTHRPSREQEPMESGIKEEMHRDDLLEGAENIHEKVVSELSESDIPSMCSLSARPLPEVFIEADAEDLVMSAAAKVLDGSKSQIQKRSVAVRDLPKGIYVTNTASAGKNNLRTGTDAALEPLEMRASQEKRDGQKKKILQQFPLLQGLMGSGLRTSKQGQKF